MSFDYPTEIGKLTDEQRLLFYEWLAHNLTVGARGVWTNDELSDPQKLERLKTINEILHRITAKISCLRLGQNEFPESDTWKMIQDHVADCPFTGGEVAWAITASFKYASS